MSLLKRLEQQRGGTESSDGAQETIVKVRANDTYAKLKERVRTHTIEELNEVSDADAKAVRDKLEEVLQLEADDLPRTERARIANELFDDIMGYGPLETLLADPTITEIMINGHRQVFIERQGRLHQAEVALRDQEHVMNIIDRIVSSIGRHVDEASPMVDARLKDGSRVNVILPPLSLVGPVVTIRKFSKTPYTAQNLIDFGSISPKMVSFLEACVKGRLNLIVSGGTGSGKTTLLNILSGFIPSDERIVTIEDAAEIQLNQAHVVTLESRPANTEGRGQITIRDLVRNALRMRPDRIIVGEVRSSEALDMLQAMNTGHDGSLTTTHANSPRDTIARLETMVMMGGMELPLLAIRSQIASAIDIIIQQSRFRDGTRRITNITEITGMEGDIVSMQDLFVYETQGQMDSQGHFKGKFKGTGVFPHCLEKIRNNGIAVHDEWFM
ncbi:MAG: CpaF family protein [Christensenellales bacterium]